MVLIGYRGVDTIVMAAAVTKQPTWVLVSRCISPVDNGGAHNGDHMRQDCQQYFAGEVEMAESTLRTTDRMVRQNIIDTMTRMVKVHLPGNGRKQRSHVTPGICRPLIPTGSGGGCAGWKQLLTSLGGTYPLEEVSHAWVGGLFIFPGQGQGYVFIIWAAPAKGKRPPRRPFAARTDMDETCLKLGVEMQTRLALRLLEREVNQPYQGERQVLFRQIQRESGFMYLAFACYLP